MLRLEVLSLAALAVVPALAQTTASVRSVTGCVAPNPEGLLDVELDNTTAWVVGQDGVGVIEIESIPHVLGWSNDSLYPGFTGTHYYRWAGGDFFNTPGRGGLIYRFFVEEAGHYQLRIHNRHNHPNPAEQNDCWLSVNGAQWEKVFSNNGRNAGVWNWDFKFDSNRRPVSYNLVQGLNEVRISGRSNGFMIDRLVVFRDPGTNGEDTAIPESPLLRERPVLGETFDVLLGRGAGALGFTPGQTIGTLLWEAEAAPTCGQVLPGFGRSAGGVVTDGELLLSPTRIAILVGPRVWNGSELVTRLVLPEDPATLGLDVFIQGLLIDIANGVFEPALTPRLDLRIGDI